tara:strand:- start:902 stop:1363 length:462 start_codon:yes stop_codon:yes gene_type:complete
MVIPNWQKITGLGVYLLPWSDALPFGSNLFVEFPFLQTIAIPALPLIIIERLIPFGGFIIFIGLFAGVVRNPKVPYFIRFNCLQAILLDISLILINYAFQILLKPLGNALIFRTLSSTCLIAMLSVMIFAVSKCLQGEEPDIPGFSEAVRMQL